MMMRSNELRIASLFSFLYAALTLFYSYKLIYGEHSRAFIVFCLVVLTILLIIVFLYFKRFLKYYYNYKDKENFIIYIIVFEVLHNVFMMVFLDRLNHDDDLYFVYSTVVALLSAILITFYILFSVRLFRLGAKYTRLMQVFSFLFILIPILTIISFLFSLFIGKDLFTSLEYNNSSFLFAFLKLFPIIVLPALYYRSYLRKKYKYRY